MIPMVEPTNKEVLEEVQTLKRMFMARFGISSDAEYKIKPESTPSFYDKVEEKQKAPCKSGVSKHYCMTFCLNRVRCKYIERD